MAAAFVEIYTLEKYKLQFMREVRALPSHSHICGGTSLLSNADAVRPPRAPLIASAKLGSKLSIIEAERSRAKERGCGGNLRIGV